MKAVAQAAISVRRAAPSLVRMCSIERAWLDPESGKVFCLSSGPSKEAVMRIHERAGHPTTEVYELPIEV